MSKLENETVIDINDAEDIANIATRQKSIINKLKKMGLEPIYTQAGYERYVVPKKWIYIKPPKEVTQKQREAGCNNLLKGRKKQKNS